MEYENPKRRPVDDRIGEDTIRAVVHGFYAEIRADEVLGPIFAHVVTDWEPHLAKMCDFWSSMMSMTGRYKGNPMVAHMRLKMARPEHFERWLTLFRRAAREICETDVAELFIARAENIARSLQLGMFYRPADKTPTFSPPSGP